MTNFHVTAVALAALLAACGGGSDDSSDDVAMGRGAFAGTSSSTSPVCKALDGYLDGDADAVGKVPGYSFAVFDGNGLLLTCAGGNQKLSAILPIASASKLPAAAAIMTLVDSNQLQLDLPIAFYLRDSGVDWPLDKIRITMRMLLAHTSGLPGLGPDDTQPACLDDPTGITLRDCVQQIADAPLAGTPGLAFNYGAADYQVAGYVAALIAGQSWADFFETRISQPIGLGVYTYGGAARVSNPRIAGGAVSNLADYVNILRMFLNDGRAASATVLSARSIRILETNQIALRSKKYSPVDDDLYPGYSFGFFISDESLHPGSRGPELSGPGLFGTIPWIDTDLGYGGVLLINKDAETGVAMWNSVRPLIIEALTHP